MNIKTGIERLENPATGFINVADELLRLKANPPNEDEKRASHEHYERILADPDADPELVKLIQAAKSARQYSLEHTGA